MVYFSQKNQILRRVWQLGCMLFFLAQSASAETSHSSTLAQFCTELKKQMTTLRWKIDPCEGINWKIGGYSVNGRPLVYADFGPEQAANVSLVLTMVHGDEITPLYLGLRLVRWIQENRKVFVSILNSNDLRIVIAPLVNPDGFLRSPRTRMNSHGVDVNRNFQTQDWEGTALKSWKFKHRSDPRRFPGMRPRSEPETLFQEDLIRKIRPHKVLSVHAPLNFMDYDGPTVLSLNRFPEEYVKECLKLQKRLKAISGGFYPGSLGNYSGNELGIPTLTLELPSANPMAAEKYWKQFLSGIEAMIRFRVPVQRAMRWSPVEKREDRVEVIRFDRDQSALQDDLGSRLVLGSHEASQVICSNNPMAWN